MGKKHLTFLQETRRPRKEVYKIISNIHWTKSIHPEVLVKNIFRLSQFIKCSKKSQIIKRCHGNQQACDYILSKMYLLHWTRLPFRELCFDKIRNIVNSTLTDHEAWDKFKRAFPISKCASEFDSESIKRSFLQIQFRDDALKLESMQLPKKENDYNKASEKVSLNINNEEHG